MLVDKPDRVIQILYENQGFSDIYSNFCLRVRICAFMQVPFGELTLLLIGKAVTIQEIHEAQLYTDTNLGAGYVIISDRLLILVTDTIKNLTWWPRFGWPLENTQLKIIESPKTSEHRRSNREAARFRTRHCSS